MTARATILSASMCLLLSSTEGAYAQPSHTLRVRVQDEQSSPLSAFVRRVGTNHDYPTDGSGVARVNIAGCDGSVVLIARARDNTQYNARQRTVPCSPDPDPFELTRSETARLSDRAYTYLSANAPASARLAELRASLIAAIERGADGEVALLAIDFASAVQAEGDPALAESFRALAQQAGVRAIAPDPALDLDRYLSISPDGGITTTPDGTVLVRDFQREIGLRPSGRFTPRTMEAIRHRAQPRGGIVISN